MKTTEDLHLTYLPTNANEKGKLTVMERANGFPFDIARVFIVQAQKGQVRGMHAHRQCQQFLVCTSGRIKVECDDGQNKATFILERSNEGLLLYCGIWASQTYLEEGSVLSVFCDRPFEESDYLRNYDEFRTFRNMKC